MEPFMEELVKALPEIFLKRLPSDALIQVALLILEKAAKKCEKRSEIGLRLLPVLSAVKTVNCIEKWCIDVVEIVLKKEITTLASKEHGLHASATHATLAEMRNFDAQTLAIKYQNIASHSWRLLYSIMDATGKKRKKVEERMAERNVRKRRTRASAPKHGEEDDIGYSEDDNFASSESEGELDTGPVKLITGCDSNGVRIRKRFDLLQRYDNKRMVRTVTALSIAAQSSNSHANLFQASVGMHLLACQAGRRVTRTLTACGMSIAERTIDLMNKSLSADACRLVQVMVAENLTMVTYDNFNFRMNVAESRLGHDSSFKNMTTATFSMLYNTNAKDLECIEALYKFNLRNVRRDESIPYTHPSLPALIKSFTDNPPFPLIHNDLVFQIARIIILSSPELEHLYPSLLERRKPVYRLPLRKTALAPARALDEDEGTLHGNAAVLDNLYREQGAYSREQGKRAWFVNGDLATGESIQRLILYRSVEETSLVDKYGHILFQPGWFHILYAILDAIMEMFVPEHPIGRQTKGDCQSKDARGSFHYLLAKVSPRKAAQFKRQPDYRLAHEAIQIVIAASIRDCAEVELSQVLDDWVKQPHTIDEILDLSSKIYDGHVAGVTESMDEKGIIEANQRLMHRECLLYIGTHEMVKLGDIGRLERYLCHYIPIWNATGKHKYARFMLEHMVNLRCNFPSTISQPLRDNWLENWTGKEGEWNGCDLYQEICNLRLRLFIGDVKDPRHVLNVSPLVDFYFECHKNHCKGFRTTERSSKHTSPDERGTVRSIQADIKSLKLNSAPMSDEEAVTMKHARKLDAFQEGLDILATKTRKKGGHENPFVGLKPDVTVRLPTIIDSVSEPFGSINMDIL